jgi:hypothetical protein
VRPGAVERRDRRAVEGRAVGFVVTAYQYLLIHFAEKSLAFIGNVAAGGCRDEAEVWIAGHFR